MDKEQAIEKEDGRDDPIFQKWKRAQENTMAWMLAIPSGKLGYDLYKGGMLEERTQALQAARWRKEGANREKCNAEYEKLVTAREKLAKEKETAERAKEMFIKESLRAEESKGGQCHAWIPKSLVERKHASGKPLTCSVCKQKLI